MPGLRVPGLEHDRWRCERCCSAAPMARAVGGVRRHAVLAREGAPRASPDSTEV